MNNQDEIVYIEIDHWCAGRDYPDCEPVLSWMGNETYGSLLRDEDWIKENKICVKVFPIDMSWDFMITAPKSFVEKVCPCFLEEKYSKFITCHENYDDLEDTPESRYVGSEECFLPYIDENIGTLQDGKDWY